MNHTFGLFFAALSVSPFRLKPTVTIMFAPWSMNVWMSAAYSDASFGTTYAGSGAPMLCAPSFAPSYEYWLKFLSSIVPTSVTTPTVQPLGAIVAPSVGATVGPSVGFSVAAVVGSLVAVPVVASVVAAVVGALVAAVVAALVAGGAWVAAVLGLVVAAGVPLQAAISTAVAATKANDERS